MFEVHHYTLCDGWVNCWETFDEYDQSKPERFDTMAEAQAEIDEMFEEIEQEIKFGEREPDEGFDRSDFRIYNVTTGEYVG